MIKKSNNYFIAIVSAICLLIVTACNPPDSEKFVEDDTEIDNELTIKAKAGDAEAQNELGNYYLENYQLIKAAKWHKAAAWQGYAPAQLNLYEDYYSGSGVVQNIDSAVYYARKAAEQDNESAQYALGLLYEFGVGLEQDYVQAAYWYEKAASKGNSNALYGLGVLYLYGDGVEQNNEKYMHYLRESANQGNPQAQYNLGLRYKYGDIIKRDQNLYVQWIKKAAYQNYYKALMEMAYLYQNGIVVEKDLPKSEEYAVKSIMENPHNNIYQLIKPLLAAQEKSEKVAQIEPLDPKKIETETERLYHEGFKLVIGNQNQDAYQLGIFYLVQAALNGYKNAKILLSYCFSTGTGIASDPKIASKLYVGKGTIKWKGQDGNYIINFEVFYNGSFTEDMDFRPS